MIDPFFGSAIINSSMISVCFFILLFQPDKRRRDDDSLDTQSDTVRTLLHFESSQR